MVEWGNMKDIISKEELNEWLKIEGEIRGHSIKNTGEFILKEEGKEGLEKLESTMAELGYPIKYSKIKETNYYPAKTLAITFVLIERIFNYDTKKFQEMGKFRAKFSIIMRMLMRYLISLDRAIKEMPKMWRKFLTTGDARVVSFDKKEKWAIIRIENYHFHQIQCRVIEGIFSTILQAIVKSNVTCQEIKCVHRGDKYHEFLLKW